MENVNVQPILFPTGRPKRSKLKVYYVRLFLRKYLTFLFPVVLLSIILNLRQVEIEQHLISGFSYFNFLILSAMITPAMAQSVSFPFQSKINSIHGMNRKVEILQLFLSNLVPIIFGVVLRGGIFAIGFSYLLNLSSEASFAFFLHISLNCIFAIFLQIVENLKYRKYWSVIWLSYITLFYIFPCDWFVPSLVSVLISLLLLWRNGLKISGPNFSGILFRQAIEGLILGLIIWFDKILLFLLSPEMFSAEYVFISLIPCVLTLNYYYVFIQRNLSEVINSLIWGIGNYNISRYITSQKESLKVLRRSLLRVFVFSVITCIATLVIAQTYLPDAELLAKHLVLCVLVTNTSILLTIHLYFQAGKVFYLASAFVYFAIFQFVILEGFLFSVMNLVALGFFVLAAVFTSTDLTVRWRAPHKRIFNFT